ncbi:MobH family relaxase [Conservatibacter flavescens]|uniref:Relaxase n=1 Tax=Conservatibacter flavescens TaxID=28161 RepID=A0A2M8S129_9PAST|nr:MobH family relaxase [Conservatibacter flavescens]PJG84828.1 relaxase [Conservatibacter flavescens]
MFKSLTKLFKSKSTTHQNITVENPLPRQDIDGWIMPYSAVELLDTELRQRYLALLWQQVSMTREMFNNLYQKPLERYAEMVQLLPASESHHHSHLGGMLDHGLEVISFAAKLRQNYVLPLNAVPEEQAKQKDAWTAAVIYLALVHDIGKTIVDIEIQLKNGKRWFAWNGVPTEPYKFKYIKQRDYELHPVLGSFIANYLIPKEAFDWLATYPEAFSSLMYAMAGHYDKAGALSEIIQKADQNSVALALGGDITKLVQAPVISFAKQLVLAIRHVVTQKLKISEKGPGDGWLTEHGLWVMSKTVADQTRAYLMGQGISVPADNRKLFDEMQAHNIIESTADDTAIWYCLLKADNGWKPKDKFSLLRIKPEIIWENIDDRPLLFAGSINVIESEKENIDETDSESIITKINANVDLEQLSEHKEEVYQKTEAEIHNRDNESVDFLLNMFSQDSIGTAEKTNEVVKAEAEIKTLKPETISNLVAQSVAQDTINDTTQSTHISKVSSSSVQRGWQFVDWLKNKLLNDKLTFNDRTAKVHIVDNCLFIVSPSSFEMYLQEKGLTYDEESVNNLQYEFQELGLHKKRIIGDDSTNFWRCKVIGPRKDSFLVGYLVPDTKLFFGEKLLINNRHLLLEE